MLYFRDEEKRLLRQFYESESDRAMAVYGRRRTGKTHLMMEFYHSFGEDNPCVYYQCASFDYRDCLKDFIELIKPLAPESLLFDRMLSFREVFQFLSQIGINGKIFILDEFPFLAKRFLCSSGPRVTEATAAAPRTTDGTTLSTATTAKET